MCVYKWDFTAETYSDIAVIETAGQTQMKQEAFLPLNLFFFKKMFWCGSSPLKTPVNCIDVHNEGPIPPLSNFCSFHFIAFPSTLCHCHSWISSTLPSWKGADAPGMLFIKASLYVCGGIIYILQKGPCQVKINSLREPFIRIEQVAAGQYKKSLQRNANWNGWEYESNKKVISESINNSQ